MSGSGGIVPPRLTSTLDGGEWSASRPGRFTPGTHWIGCWVDLGVGLDVVEQRKMLPLLGIEPVALYTEPSWLCHDKTC
jgi:hypothetical protein